MPRRPAPEALSPRALARLRAGPRAYVPTAADLDTGPGRSDRERGEDAGWVRDRHPGPTPVEDVRQWPDERPPAPTPVGDMQRWRGERHPGPTPVRDVQQWPADSRAVAHHGPPRSGGPDVGGADPGPGPGDGHGRGRGRGDGGRHVRPGRPRTWARLPAAFVGARWQPGRAALVGVVVMAALAVAVFGLRVAWAQSAGDGTVLAPGGGARAGPTGVAAGAVPVGAPSPSASAWGSGAGSGAGIPAARPGAAGAGPASGMVVVHVVGQVRHPGVRRLPAGSRVSDAVEAAGGATRTADLGLLNLARVLVDGEQVRVPAPGEEVSVAPVVPGTGGGGAGGDPGAGAGPVSLNTADLATLDTLPGVGPVLAQRILDWRSAHGRFASVDELGEVSGIGDKLLAQLSPLVTL